METLKKLIESAKKKQREISQKENLAEQIMKKGSANISGAGYCDCSFGNERREKILSLVIEFIEEDRAALEPLTTKLNLISDLVKGE